MSMQPSSEQTQYLLNQIELSNAMRRLWSDSIQWTRSLIYSILFDLGDVEPITQRLVKNAEDFSDVFTQIYGQQAGARVRELLFNRYRMTRLMIDAYKTGDTRSIEGLRSNLLRNAEDLARLFSSLNRFWDRVALEVTLHSITTMTENEIVQIMTGHYADSVTEYEEIQRQTMHLADDLIYGIIRQFQT